MKQTLTFTNRVHLPLESHPIAYGVPWPQGAVTRETRLVARDETGAALPVASRVLNCWPDGSAQWTLVNLALDLGPSDACKITIDSAAGPAAPPAPRNPVTVRQDAAGITVANGLTTLTIPTAPGDSLVEGWEAGRLDAVITDADGVIYSAARCKGRKVWIEDANPLRIIVRIDGKHQADDGRTLLDFWARFTVTAGRRDVKVTYHYHNLEKCEPGIFLRSMALELRAAVPADAQRAIVHSMRTRETRPEPYRLSEDFEICASNTQDLANYPKTHQGITGGGNGRVFIRQAELLRDDPMKKPWFVRNVVDFKFQTMDPPETHVWSFIGLASPRGSLLVSGGNMAGLHPKSLSVKGNFIRYALWPEWAGTMDITQGEGRSLDFNVGPLPPDADDMQFVKQYFSWEFGSIFGHWGTQATVQIAPDIEHVRKCEVFQVHKLPPYAPRDHFCFERKVEAQWAPSGFIPALGHWHYGDIFARWDIGANNEEMVGHVWFQEYLRSGRPICLERGLAQAQHIADVDICSFSNDPYQNGGMCSHGPRHNHSAAYPSHMWFTEMLFAYALTGDEEFKKAAVRVCDNLCYWVNDEKMGFHVICSDGRESGQPLINLSWTYQFVPDPHYMAAMKKIVRVSFMDRVKKHGTLAYMKPREEFALLKMAGYGEWAAWEGLYYVWELTRDEELKRFILSQLEWRLQEERMATSGTFRDTDFNVAAYAFYLTGDRQWLDRAARPFNAVFRAVQWPFGYIKSMFFIKLAFEHKIVRDEDVLIG